MMTEQPDSAMTTTTTFIDSLSVNIGGADFVATSTQLVIEGQPTFDQWMTYGHILAQTLDAFPWIVAGWIEFGEHKWGEKYSQALTLFSEFSLKSLQNMCYVARAIPESSRHRENCSFSHCSAVAGLRDKPEQIEAREAILDRVEQDALTVAETRASVKETRARLLTLPAHSTPEDVGASGVVDDIVDDLLLDSPVTAALDDLCGHCERVQREFAGSLTAADNEALALAYDILADRVSERRSEAQGAK